MVVHVCLCFNVYYPLLFNVNTIEDQFPYLEHTQKNELSIFTDKFFSFIPFVSIFVFSHFFLFWSSIDSNFHMLLEYNQSYGTI